MTSPLSAVVVAVLLAGAPQRTMDELLPTYAAAYDTAFRRLGTLGLADTQTRIERLGEAGKPFRAELDGLRRRQAEVNDLIVKAVELKKQALVEKKTAGVEEGLRVLKEADAKAVSVAGDIKRLNEKLTAAGAAVIAPAPPRDPNARD